MPSLERLADRIRRAYTAQPELELTFPEACRLWQAEEAQCAAALDILVREGFLVRTHSGEFISSSTHRRPSSDK